MEVLLKEEGSRCASLYFWIYFMIWRRDLLIWIYSCSHLYKYFYMNFYLSLQTTFYISTGYYSLYYYRLQFLSKRLFSFLSFKEYKVCFRNCFLLWNASLYVFTDTIKVLIYIKNNYILKFLFFYQLFCWFFKNKFHNFVFVIWFKIYLPEPFAESVFVY